MKGFVNVTWRVASVALVHLLVELQLISITYSDFCCRMIFECENGDDGPQRAPYVVSYVMRLCRSVPLLERLEGRIEMRVVFHSIAIASATKYHCAA